MLKSSPEKPVSGFGVIDAFDTPTMGYYVQKRTFAPVTMSFAIRYALESKPTGSPLQAPVWISNATDDAAPLAIDCALYDLKGDLLLESHTQSSVPAMQAREVLSLDWRLPEEPGIYLLRGQAERDSKQVASAEMYVKVVPRATRKAMRVLVLGTPEWAEPVADYLANLGASTTRVIFEATAIREPENPFPASAGDLAQKYDAIWLAGFDDYWREAPEHVTETIVQAVESGVPLIHSGSWASFHGGGERAAALDLTALAQVLPVETLPENDIFAKTSYKTGTEINEPPASSRPGAIAVGDAAPEWVRKVEFTGLAPESYHILQARPGARVLLRMGDQPLLVSGHFGKGLVLAYLGFSPEGPANRGGGGAGSMSARDRQPVIVDRAIRSSAEGRLFTIITASLLALASGEDPQARIADLVDSRATPVFETLKNLPPAPWPKVTLSWVRSAEEWPAARIHISNGPAYFRGLRLRFDGRDFRDGSALSLWSNQFFDLLPGEQTDVNVEFIREARGPSSDVSLEAETLYGTESKRYPIPPHPQVPSQK